MRILRLALLAPLALVKLLALAYFCLRAYRIRLHAVTTFGYIIHEFDPWFNYRATEYLAAHGWKKFFSWYDYMSWYPLGRPVGTTIYPGMQIVSVWIWQALEMIPQTVLKIPKKYWSQLPAWVLPYLPYKGRQLAWGPMSVNDVCCMVPAWFGAVATLFTFLWAREVSESTTVGVIAAFIMATSPAHLMRSMAGEFDNEAVAVTTFCAVLWLWCRSVRNPKSWPWGVLAGIMYMCTAATWGGYIFINNIIALHAAFVVAVGKYNDGLYRAFSLYYIIGTVGAMMVPVIGWTPLRSVEQMPSLMTFAVFQLMHLCDLYRRRQSPEMSGTKFFVFRAAVFATAAALVGAGVFVLLQMGYFMPLGARIRGLFLEAVKTGNPLVDSVAEHSPASSQAYEQYLGTPRIMAVAGLLFCWHQKTPAKFIVFLYALVAWHYSLKMSRLIIICGPIVSVLAAYPPGLVLDWCIEQCLNVVSRSPQPKEIDSTPLRTGGMGSILRSLWASLGGVVYPQEIADVVAFQNSVQARWWMIFRPLRAIIALIVLLVAYLNSGYATDYWKKCDEIAPHMAHPHLVFETKLQNGKDVIVDDYLKGYEWIKANTPQDARVMAWWDYGYQITGVANRTSLADGNTWNHEHIATLGRILTSAQRRSWNAQRHLADYVLVWAGGHGDDLGKSPHLARIGNSVFPDHCGDSDPLCQKFSFFHDGKPTPMMAESFLYKAVKHGMEGVKLSSKYWQEVHTTKYGLMRVYKVLNVSQESKEWAADPANRKCDSPGSWYCVGQYPPALAPLIEKRRNFAQLEDFNKQGGQKSAYTELIEKHRKGEAEL